MRRFTRQEVIKLISHYPDVFTRKKAVQDIVFQHWLDTFERGTLEIATGVGKTLIALMAIARALLKNPKANIIIAVPTATLRDVEWPDEFRKWDYTHLLSSVQIVTHAAIHDIKVQGDIDLFIWDEIHHLTPKACGIFDKYQIWSRMGLSALVDGPNKDTEKSALLAKYFPICFRITLDDALDLGLIADFEILVLKFLLDDKNMNIVGGTKANPTMVTEQQHYETLTKRLGTAKSKGTAGFFWIQKRTELISNLPTKKQLAKEIMQLIIKDGKRTIIFCGSKNQCADLGPVDHIFHSGTTPKALDAFNNKTNHYLLCIKAVNEGKNLDEVDQSLVVQISAQEKDIVQRIGRNVRFREGHKGKIIILVAANTMDEYWCKQALYNIDRRKIKTHWIQPKLQTYGA